MVNDFPCPRQAQESDFTIQSSAQFAEVMIATTIFVNFRMINFKSPSRRSKVKLVRHLTLRLMTFWHRKTRNQFKRIVKVSRLREPDLMVDYDFP